MLGLSDERMSAIRSVVKIAVNAYDKASARIDSAGMATEPEGPPEGAGRDDDQHLRR
jgi:hypothetical protein